MGVVTLSLTNVSSSSSVLMVMSLTQFPLQQMIHNECFTKWLISMLKIVGVFFSFVNVDR